ncbi:hypothetical protein [Thermoanaerobacter wiegelii]|uniref:DUF7916 domain-containing protein n=1 Tax=Thermoanaerobacter wiegelii Rt8.B1 TaxID=697303 RepID=G2MQT9_9THEO|nr:hypothetical protein [Thermoanaerobacter wiegelii]AEM77988.1 hypothetical protein Thewi_0527 [Thermoanaerobacter wiegelii Rt8.B1]
MKRIFELTMKDIERMDKNTLIETIKTSEGRTVMAETIVTVPPLIYGVSNMELAAAFGSDMITLNFFDFQKPFIFGIDDIEINFSAGPSEVQKIVEIASKNAEDFDYIKRLKKIVGRFIGVNIEPVPEGVKYVEGRKLNRENLLKAKEYGFDYIVITGNPNTGVSASTIIKGIELAKEILGENMMIIAGKMHGAGSGNIFEDKILKDFVKAGADCVLIPAPGTVPGIDLNLAKRQIDRVHEESALAMTTIGTSQEGSQKSTIEFIGVQSKMAGADIQHIGDAGYAGIALPENIMALSIAIRGVRHTYRRMAYSLNK